MTTPLRDILRILRAKGYTVWFGCADVLSVSDSYGIRCRVTRGESVFIVESGQRGQLNRLDYLGFSEMKDCLISLIYTANEV